MTTRSTATPASTTLNGNTGDDTLSGGDGNDTLNGNDGGDALNGNLGDDTLNGGAGNDTLSGSDGNDALNGNVGDDTLSGGDGNDKLNGGDGVNTLRGGDGDDTLDREPAPRTPAHRRPRRRHLVGGAGDDQIVAIDGFADTITCGAGRRHGRSPTSAPNGVVDTTSTNPTELPEGRGHRRRDQPVTTTTRRSSPSSSCRPRHARPVPVLAPGKADFADLTPPSASMRSFTRQRLSTVVEPRRPDPRDVQGGVRDLRSPSPSTGRPRGV